MPLAHTDQLDDREGLLDRLWIYTNYDCNLSCSYCVAESFVGAERKGLTLPQVCRLIDEAVEIGMTELFFTGGEPFILHDIFSMLHYGLERMHVTVLSNGILLKGQRLQQLKMLPYRERLTIQISLDGSNAATHDFYRGAGSWQKAIDAIGRLKAENFHVRLGTTQTPENSQDLAAMCQLHRTRSNRESRWCLLAPRRDCPRSADLTLYLSAARGSRADQRDPGVSAYGHWRSVQSLSLRVSSLYSV